MLQILHDQHCLTIMMKTNDHITSHVQESVWFEDYIYIIMQNCKLYTWLTLFMNSWLEQHHVTPEMHYMFERIYWIAHVSPSCVELWVFLYLSGSRCIHTIYIIYTYYTWLLMVDDACSSWLLFRHHHACSNLGPRTRGTKAPEVQDFPRPDHSCSQGSCDGEWLHAPWPSNFMSTVCTCLDYMIFSV